MKLFRQTISMALSAVLTFTAAGSSGAFFTSAEEDIPAGEEHVPGVHFGDEFEWCWSTVREDGFIFGIRRDRFDRYIDYAEVSIGENIKPNYRQLMAEDECRYQGANYYDSITGKSVQNWLVDELILLDYEGDDRDVIVPAEVDGRPVTALGANAFSCKSAIDSVTLPDSIDYVPARAFSDSSVREVNIPESLMVIPDAMFSGCEALTEVTGFDHLISCAPDAFAGTDITVPDSIVRLEAIDSQNVSYLENTDGWNYRLWWNGTGYMGKICGMDQSNYGAPDEEVEICPPEKLKSIPIQAFDLNMTYIPGQIHLVFPESYTYIFSDCSKKSVKSVEFLNKDAYFKGSLAGSGITSIELPSRAVYTAGMFRGCTELKTFSAAEGTEEALFGNRFFEGCTSLETVTLPESCTKLTIGNEAFMNDSSLRKLVLPSSVVFSAVGDTAFSGCESLEKMTIPAPEGADVVIEKNAFTGCRSLKEFTVSQPFGSLTIGKEAFKGCTLLDTLNLPECTGSVDMGQYAFTGTAISSLTAEDNWSIGSCAFHDCKNLETVTLNGTNVGQNAFEDCPALEELTVTGAAKLGLSAVNRCPSLKDLIIKGDEYKIKDTFFDCPELRTINGTEVFDSSTGDFAPAMKDMVLDCFASADNVGFINDYVDCQVKKTVAEIIEPDMSEMDKVRAVHDWICGKTRYSAAGETGATDHNDASVFLMDSTVCDGYARAFNLLAHEAGIETCAVHSSDHAWNIVRIGGLYFHVDTTWDDQRGDHRWFLLTDEEMKKAGGTHRSWSLNLPSALHSFQTDKLPESVRSMGDANADGSINTADLVCLSRYLLGSGELSMDDATVCDLNFDGTADTFDMVKLRSRLIG